MEDNQKDKEHRETYQCLYGVLLQGKIWASSLKAGDLFEGCMPEANKRYTPNSIEANLFASGAIDVLQRTDLYISEDGYITRIERN